MKKISILIALALIVTIGGVYATWNYNSQNAVNDSHEHLNLNMADYVAGENAKGKIEIFDNSMKIAIDDTDNNHVAEISLTGEMIFIFTPYNNASADVKANGITMQYTVGQSGTLQFTPDGSNTPVNIFNITTGATVLTATKITNDNATTLYEDYDLSDHVDSFAVRIQANEVKDKITLNGTFTLNTLDLYHDFQEALGSGQVGITVSEKLS